MAEEHALSPLAAAVAAGGGNHRGDGTVVSGTTAFLGACRDEWLADVPE